MHEFEAYTDGREQTDAIQRISGSVTHDTQCGKENMNAEIMTGLPVISAYQIAA